MRRPLCLLPALLLSGLGACTQPAESPADIEFHSRIVSLAPNLTELVFAAGAGETLVGVSAYSDYPIAAQELPVVGDAFTVDQEQLASLRPDTLLVWQSGTPQHVVEELRRVGFNVTVLRTSSLEDVAVALRRIGQLTGFTEDANAAAGDYTSGLANLREEFAAEPLIRVFYQVSRRPLFTVNGDHYVSQLIELCGGQNIFADLNELAPTIDVEAVVERDPEVMLASDDAGEMAFAEWRRWPQLAANRYTNHYLLPADEIGRATPRLLQAGTIVCESLQQARRSRAAVDTP